MSVVSKSKFLFDADFSPGASEAGTRGIVVAGSMLRNKKNDKNEKSGA